MCGFRVLMRRPFLYRYQPFQHRCISYFPHVGVPCPASPASSPRYEYVEGVERLDRYRPGGYHPVRIGDHLQGQYRIVHKLGYGTFSTIWLARDERLAKYVAVKVGTADSNQKEATILKRLTDSHQVENRVKCKVLTPLVLDQFNLDGPNGVHPCLVTTPARCSLADLRDTSGTRVFQLKVARSLATQLTIAVARVHDLGYVHGDLHLGNILLQLQPGLDELSEAQIYDEFGSPDPEPVSRVDGKPLPPGVPPHVFCPAWFGDKIEKITLAEAKLLLTDFGVAFCPAQESRFESYTPLEIRPPEARFEPTKPLSFASDIWSLGCVIWAIVGQRSFLDSFLFSQDDVTSDQIDALGPLPPAWWEKWETRSKRFNDNGQPKEGRSVWSWEQRFEDGIQEPRREEGMETICEQEKDAFFEMIRWMLAFQPEDRPSIRQVLDMTWMGNWAIPECERSWK